MADTAISEQAPTKKRGNPNWVKGVSGNPGGRVQLEPEIKAMRALKANEAFRVACGLLDSDNERVRLEAAKEIMDRGWGRPQQSVAVSYDNASTAELVERARERLAQLEAENALN